MTKLREENLERKIAQLETELATARARIVDLEFDRERLPDIECVADNHLADDLYMIFELGIARLGYPRFQQLLDESLDRCAKYYGPPLYMRVR